MKTCLASRLILGVSGFSCLTIGCTQPAAVQKFAGSLLPAAGPTAAAAVIPKANALPGLVINPNSKNAKTAAIVMTAAWGARQIYAKLNQKDKAEVANNARRTAATGKDQTYKNPDTGVKVQSRVVREETKKETVSVPVLKDHVDQVPPLDLIGEVYAAKAAAEIRSGPGTNYKIAGNLSPSEQVNVMGQVQNQPWFLIGQGGPASGFVATSVLNPVPGAAISLAEVDTSSGLSANATATADFTVERKYRVMEQTIETADGQKSTVEVTARQSAQGWEMAGAQ